MQIIKGLSFPLLLIICICLGSFIYYLIEDNDENENMTNEMMIWIVIFSILLGITFVSGIVCIINIYKN